MIVVPSYAVDSVSFEFGTGNKTKLVRTGLQWKWDTSWEVGPTTQVSGYWDLSLARWRSDKYRDVADAHQNLWAIGISPVLRLASKENAGMYFEAGLGPHLLSDLYDNNSRQLSTRFQFGSHIGLGYVFSNKLDTALRFQHYSNGGIKDPNDGVNFLLLRISYPL